LSTVNLSDNAYEIVKHVLGVSGFKKRPRKTARIEKIVRLTWGGRHLLLPESKSIRKRDVDGHVTNARSAVVEMRGVASLQRFL